MTAPERTPRRPRQQRAVVAVAAVLAAVLLAVGAQGLVDRLTPPEAEPPQPAVDEELPEEPAPAEDEPEPAAEVVRVEVGDDLQALVDAHPPGTHYVLGAGVHRLQSVIPSDGDRFTGEPGAVLSGARELPADWFAFDGWLWSVEGQSQEGPFDEGLAQERMLPGFEVEERVEELFSDGERLRRVGSPEEMTEGAWYFDHDTDRIYVAQEPSTLGLIETSVALFAFGGNGVRDVTVEDLVIEKYATPAQHGAIGGWEQHQTIGWTVRNVEVRDNHGGGIRVGPGMTVEGSKIHRNGQIGLSGNGVNRSQDLPGAGHSAPVTVRDNEITANRVLGYDWGWEGGGTKFAHMEGMLAERNWVHGNHGPGLWWDIENRDVVARGNLVEDNDQAGIFYEISYGPTEIVGNTVRGNGREGSGHEGAGIDISASSDVRVRHNAVYDNRHGILVRTDDRGWETANVEVVENDIRMTRGLTGLRDDLMDPAVFTDRGNRFEANTYRLDSSSRRRFYWNYAQRDAAGWRAQGQDVDGVFLDASETPIVPVAALAFEPSAYGPHASDDALGEREDARGEQHAPRREVALTTERDRARAHRYHGRRRGFRARHAARTPSRRHAVLRSARTDGVHGGRATPGRDRA